MKWNNEMMNVLIIVIRQFIKVVVIYYSEINHDLYNISFLPRKSTSSAPVIEQILSV